MDCNVTNYFRNENLYLPGLEWSHVALKRLFNLVDNRLKNWKPATNEEIQTTVRAIKRVDDFMSSCKSNEHTLAWPYLKGHDRSAAEVLAKSDALRDVYEAKMTDLNSLLSKIESMDPKNLSDEERTQVSSKFTDVHKEMVILLSYQEVNILPFFIATPKDEQTKLGKQIQSNDKELQESFAKNSPWVARKLMKNVFSKKSYGWFINYVDV
ncbi:hypothetical protein PPL_06644 [Heterostelium album PN500]|uniref:Uncharacterized protein n=1 Tax=Heterostelium pallidum (strain ATCC 26659 / Pp 5 / PN500) TaxID=670386 RepID=D3BFB1_HETP5|nr:hypothetical protein PPL_06644 [Heterostelium album PN500]EFA79825.1 hypothetical protein PPL_06644 [Heterostelium album PN500]|eukprot:XP_020431946.1 hypothetical protein PPL_06644 [Heterostelium album PN500]